MQEPIVLSACALQMPKARTVTADSYCVVWLSGAHSSLSLRPYRSDTIRVFW
jgi:hypothetical protein